MGWRVEAALSAFANRLEKDFRHYGRWARRQGLTAFGIYDLDLPEVPWAIDWYAGKVHAAEYPRSRQVRESRGDEVRARVVTVIQQVLQVAPSDIFVKVHAPKRWGEEQYLKQGNSGERFW